MHKEQIHTLQQLQRRHVTYLAREPYCDSVGLLLSFWLKCTVCGRVFCSIGLCRYDLEHVTATSV